MLLISRHACHVEQMRADQRLRETGTCIPLKLILKKLHSWKEAHRYTDEEIKKE